MRYSVGIRLISRSGVGNLGSGSCCSMSGLDVDFPAAMIPSRSTSNGDAWDGELFENIARHI